MNDALGSRLLGEIEEMSVEDVLSVVRHSIAPHSTHRPHHPPPVPLAPDHTLSPLSSVVARHFRSTQSPNVSVSGAGADPFIHLLITALVGPPEHRYTILVIDPLHRFDATRLDLSDDDLVHVHVLRPPPALLRPSRLDGEAPSGNAGLEDSTADSAGLAELAAKAKEWLLYAPRASRDRELWGTVVLGGNGNGAGGGGQGTVPGATAAGAGIGGDVSTGWRGWLRIERVAVEGYCSGMSAQESLSRRETRQEFVDRSEWQATSLWGGFRFEGRA